MKIDEVKRRSEDEIRVDWTFPLALAFAVVSLALLVLSYKW